MKIHLLTFSIFSILLSTTNSNAQSIEIINFEANSFSSRIDTNTYNTNHLWKVGVPNKSILKGAASPQNAIITDTVNPYSTNCSSSFIVALNQNETLRFKHKYSTTKRKDGGVIEVSADNGATWHVPDNQLLWGKGIAVMSPLNFDLGDTLFNGQFGFSGEQTSWVQDSISICYPALKKSSDFLVRFTFISDNVFDNKDGWMIDDLEITYFGGCPGAVNEQNVKTNELYPNPTQNDVTINISSEINSTVLFEIYNELGEKISTQNISLIYGINKVSIPTATLNNGIYFIKINNETSNNFMKIVVQK